MSYMIFRLDYCVDDGVSASYSIILVIFCLDCSALYAELCCLIGTGLDANRDKSSKNTRLAKKIGDSPCNREIITSETRM